MTTHVTIAIVVAMGRNRIIGRDGRLPWRMPSDLATFRRLTLGKPVVMGRATFESIGKPLAGRDNIVVSRNPAFTAPGIEVAGDLPAALNLARALATRHGVDEAMVIGGGQIYAEALPIADRIYLTVIDAVPSGDTTFPELSPQLWRLREETPLVTTPRDDHAACLRVYETTRAALSPRAVPQPA